MRRQPAAPLAATSLTAAPLTRAIGAAALSIAAACGGATARASAGVPGEAMRAATPLYAAVWDWKPQPTIEGAIEPSDMAADGDRGVDRFRVALPPGHIARVWVTSGDFDTTLRVRGARLDLYSDDAWDGTNSAAQFAVPEDGGVELEVSSFAPESFGTYALSVAMLDTQAGGAVLEGDDTLTGRLSEGGGGPGFPAVGATMWARAEAGERLHFRVTSPQIDTTLRLLGPSGHTWFNDDGHDTGPDGRERLTDSTLDAIAPSAGWYQVVAGSYGGEAGTVRVSVTRRPPITVGVDEDAPSVGYAGRNTEGRIYGVYVGITEYDDEPLFGCAQDAELVGAAFRERRLQAASDQTVLTDKRATRAAFLAALQRLSGKAGPEDVVVVFFSGHGGVLQELGGDDELDGTDETLVFVDGHLRDDELAAQLAQLRVGTLLVVIDACQSGGFARDLLTRPGRMGLFSSDEDVLSSTAEPLDRGGYLSAAFIEAVQGVADARPADGALSAGELSDFVIGFGVAQHFEMNPESTVAPAQRLIPERGSLGWADPLWVYPRIDGIAECSTGAADAGVVGGVCP